MTQVPIYLDYSATTPVDARVAEKMIPFLTENFGNPASRSHSFGWVAEKAVEEAREQVAALVNCDPKEIVWTSGATESNNLAIKGAANFYVSRGKHIITIKTEHKAVLDTVRELERLGFTATYLAPMENGLIDIDELKAAIRPDTALISVMLVNNEIGVIQDVSAIGNICREKGIIFHVDAAQATGKVEIDLQTLPVDLMSFSAHKTYGPKGIGALYVCRKPRVRLEAQMHGGGQAAATRRIGNVMCADQRRLVEHALGTVDGAQAQIAVLFIAQALVEATQRCEEAALHHRGVQVAHAPCCEQVVQVDQFCALGVGSAAQTLLKAAKPQRAGVLAAV